MVLTSVFFGANLNLIAFLSVIKEVDWKQRKFRINLVRTIIVVGIDTGYCLYLVY